VCRNFASAPCRRASGAIAQLIIVALAGALVIVPQGFAQTPAPSSRKGEQQALFDRTLKEPANLDVAFRYAEVSTKLNDFEAAIGALERMLFFNSNLPRVRLELGVLYFRLGSYEMAKNYFTNAIADPAAPPEVRSKVQAYLDEIEKRLNPNFVSGLVQTGARYQTNATAGPSGSLIRVFGFDGVLDQKFVKRSDWNFFAQGIVFQTVDLQTQRGDSWETQASAYASEQLKIKRLDVAAVGLQTGPRIVLDTGQSPGTGLSLRPYIGGSLVALEEEYYLGSGMAGAAITWLPAPGWSVELGGDRGHRTFHKTESYTTADLQTGTMTTGYVSLRGPLLDGVRWQARGGIQRADARDESQSYLQRLFELFVSYDLDLSLMGATQRLTLSPFAGISRTDYREPNFLVDPDVTRQDRERYIGLAVDTQVYKNFGLGIRVQYSRTDSNLPNFQTDNFSVSAGPTFRF
jgi:tetratricopeptide (TPR) repeat protein